MKSQSIESVFPSGAWRKPQLRSLPWGRSAFRWSLAVLAGLVPFAAGMVLTAWTINSGTEQLAAAAFWASGFVLLAVGVDAEGRTSALAFASGLLTMALAWLASRHYAEFALLAGVVVCAWLACGTISMLRALPRPETTQP